MTDTIEINFVSTNVLTRWHCHVCDGHTEKVEILCEGVDPRDDAGVRVCERCLQEGNLDQRLEETARRFEAYAARARGMIGRLKAPTYSAWLETCRFAEIRRKADIDICDAARALLDDEVDLDDRAAVEAALINPFKGSQYSAVYVDECIKTAKFNKAHPAAASV
jgi:hypothetical protein